MLRKIGLLIGVAACGALVVSCGGGGDDTDPEATATSTASPTPTPTTVVDFSLSTPIDATSSNTGTVYAYFTPTGGTETFNDANRLPGTANIKLTFAPESASFSFPDLTESAFFAGTTLTSATATQRVYTDGARKLTLQVPFAQSLRAIYEIGGQAFTRDTTAGTLRSQRVALFFNTVTTTSAIASNLTYTGTPLAVGGTPGTTPPGVITAQPVTLTVSSGTTNTITGTINLFQTINGTTTQVGSFALSATVSAAGGFSGTIDDNTYNLDGTFAGSLSGANREEVVLVFSVANTTDKRKYVGSLIGD
ncbi:hypothetical protein [Aurantiacibacter luteus]|uniref:hypothetical protein n=1 Tax=Aurantiacibacter luteus TaxID=1581420 RepID=UPI0012E0397E|nr:hypothetical protein [Aurantiacibacter luteus]